MSNASLNTTNSQYISHNVKFSKPLTQSTSADTRAHMKSIEALLKNRKCANDEITELYQYLLRSENPVSWKDVFDKDSSTQYMKWQRASRLYLLRSLTYDKTVVVAPEQLKVVAQESILGSKAVIDFMLTRAQPREEYIHELRQLVSNLDNGSDSIVSQRYFHAIEKYEAAVMSKSVQNQNMLTIETFKASQAKFNEVKKCTPEAIYCWLDHLKVNYTGSGKERAYFSRALFNLGLHFTQHKVVVSIWSLSIILDESSATSTEVSLDKMSRLISASRSYPRESFKAVSEGLKMTLIRLKIDPSTELVGSDVLSKFAQISGSILTNPDSLKILNKESDLQPSDKYSPLISRLIVQMISYSGNSARRINESSRGEFDGLMRKSCVDPLHADTIIESEWCYCSLFKSAYDYERLSTLVDIIDGETKVLLWVILARHDRFEPEKSYSWCRNMVSSNHSSLPCVTKTSQELGFFDLSPEVQHFESGTQVDVHEIKARSARLKHESADSLTLIKFNTNAWQILKHEGCYSDALEHLLLAWNLSIKSYGELSVRACTYRNIFVLYADELQIDEKMSGNNDWIEHSGKKCEYVPLQLQESVNIYFQHLESSSNSPVFDKFSHICSKSHALTEKENVNLFLSNCVTAKPPAGSRAVMNTVQDALLLSEQVDINEICWIDRMKFARDLRWLELVAVHYGHSIKTNKCAQKIASNQMYVSRAYHTGIPCSCAADDICIPIETKCVCLDAGPNDTFTITRLSPGDNEPAIFHLPLKDRGTSKPSTPVIVRITESLQGISNATKIPEKLDRQNITLYKESIRHANLDMDKFSHTLEECFFGEFIGLLTIEDITFCDPSIVESVNDYSSRFGVSVSAVVVNLMRYNVAGQCSSDRSTTIFDDLVRSIVPEADQEFIDGIRILVAGFEPLPSSKHRIVLIIGETLSQLPWELLPSLRTIAVTRALSIQHLIELSHIDSAQERLSSGGVGYLLNPDGDIPGCDRLYEDFERRKWRGYYKIQPTAEDLSSLLTNTSSFVYVGHGSANKFLPKQSMRKSYPSDAAVYSLGCRSVAVNWPSMTFGALMDHAIRGSAMIMGAIWAVRNNDFNCFTEEFSTRIFDCKQRPSEALRDSRDFCDTPYLTSAAAVIYGLP